MSQRQSNQKTMNQGEGGRDADRRYRKRLGRFVKALYPQRISYKRASDQQTAAELFASTTTATPAPTTPPPSLATANLPFFSFEHVIEMTRPLWNGVVGVQALWNRINNLNLIAELKARLDG